MMSTNEDAAAIVALPESGDLDDIGALVAAIRHMTENSREIPANDARHLYVLATMAEVAWRRLDDAMTGEKR